MKNKLTNLRTAQNKHGRYELRFDGRLLQSKVIGAIGVSLCEKFIDDVMYLCRNVGHEQWVYAGNLAECEGYTKEAESALLKLMKMSINEGCIADFYCIQSPLCIDQIKRMRAAPGVDPVTPFQFFATLDDTLEAANQALIDLTETSN